MNRAFISAAVLVAIAGGIVLYAFPPESHSFYPRCVFRSATGLECPGCGSTRALHHLLHGRVEQAFRFNPMLFAMMAVAVCAIPSAARRTMPRFLHQPWFAWTAFAVLTAYWIIRNTPLYPF